MKNLLVLAFLAVAVCFVISGCVTRAWVVVPTGPPVAGAVEYVDADGVVWLVEYDGPGGWIFTNIWIGGVFYPTYWTTDFMFYRSHAHFYHGHGYARYSGRNDHSGHRGYRNHDGAGNQHRDGHSGPGYQKNRPSTPNREGRPGNYSRPSAPTSKQPSNRSTSPRGGKKGGGGKNPH